MTTTQQFAVQHDNPYSDSPTYSHAQFTLDPKPGLCQGRRSGDKWSLRTVPCSHKATRIIKAKPYSFQSGPYSDNPAEEVELHVCGTHDLQAKGNRKAAEARKERAARAERDRRTQTIETNARQVADRINALVGEVVVDVKPTFHQGRSEYITYPIVVTNPAALMAALPGTVV